MYKYGLPYDIIIKIMDNVQYCKVSLLKHIKYDSIKEEIRKLTLKRTYFSYHGGVKVKTFKYVYGFEFNVAPHNIELVRVYKIYDKDSDIIKTKREECEDNELLIGPFDKTYSKFCLYKVFLEANYK